MRDVFALDACALVALLNKEPGAEKVKEILANAQFGAVDVVMHKLNLLEVYYGYYRESGKDVADKVIEKTMKLITVVQEINDALFYEAGRIKAKYRISLADSIALAQASISGAKLLTSDHHEFDVIDGKENIIFVWLR